MQGTALASRSRDGLPSFLAAVIHRCREDGARPDEILTQAIAEIDRRMQAQVNEILRAGPFRRLESAWNSLEYLVSEKPADGAIKLRVLNVTRDELLADFEDAVEFDRSATFQLVYEHEFGQFGGEPYSVIIADFEFANHPEDIEVLTGLAGVGAAAHAILLASADPALLGLRSWSELSVHAVPEEVRGAAWHALRDSEDSRYLGLTLPRLLLRAPHRPSDPDRTFRLREESFDADGSGLLWGSAAHALGVKIMDAFHLYGWCTAIRGLEGDQGVLRGLPEISFPTDAPGMAVVPPVEVAVSESFERALTELGLIPACRIAASARLAFFGIPSLHLPRQVDDPTIASNLKLSAQIPYMLAASRIAHYLKVMMRDHVGRFTSREEVQRELSSWLAKYTLADDHAPKDRQAQFPLRRYQVQVREKPGKPGELEAITQLQPHYQIEVPGVMLRLAVDLPDPEKTRR